jgi:selenocysteine-specific elongation factor
MHVIGTAGHVDHGKSTLIEALTGTHPDRLKEEREREMTIDLGFAWMTLPGGEEVGIIDVPGHRDFIENMLAGVGGIDATLFVIAADEGIMPQTREHLAILDILQIQNGIVALTKVDLVNDMEWLDLVEADIHMLFNGTALESAPIVRVSARNGIGLNDLVNALAETISVCPVRVNLGRPRLPVDRVFTIPGFGTVVTGTLSDGDLRLGDDIEVLSQGLRGRVRGLQTHKQKEEIAVPGSRTAVNVSGLTVDQVKRGDVIAHPGDYQPTRRLDVRFRLLGDASQPLKHNTLVKLFIGATETVARVRLLGMETIEPGGEGWLQLELKQPAVAMRGDRYILRRPSPGETLGGGEVVDPFPGQRHKRFLDETLSRLVALAKGTPVDILSQILARFGAGYFNELVIRSELDASSVSQAASELVLQGELLILDQRDGVSQIHADTLVTSRSYWEQITAQVVKELQRFHDEYPLRRGMPREELKSRLVLNPSLFNALVRKLAQEHVLLEIGALICSPDHQIRFTPQQEQKIARLMRQFSVSPYATPSVKECQEGVGEDVYSALVDLDRLIQVSAEVVFSREAYRQMVEEIKQMIQTQGSVSAAQVRDHFGTSRKYALALLEHLDTIGVTVREGDVRRLKG